MTRAAALAVRLRHPLCPLLLLVAVTGIAWALLVPPWQAPDEIAHYAYAESLGARSALPGDPRRPGFSIAQQQALIADNASPLAFYVVDLRPAWRGQDDRAYRALAAANPSRSDGGGPNAEASNPPLFYLYDALAYRLAGGNTFDRLFAMRLSNVVLILVTCAAAWLLAGEALGRRPLAQLVCAAVAALIPEETFIGASVNPDSLLVALWTLALWMGTRVIRRAAQPRDILLLAGITAAAILTKATSYALLPPVLLAVALGMRRRPAAPRRRALRGAAAGAAVLVVPVVVWLGIARHLGRSGINVIATAPGRSPRSFSPRGFALYVWQFYLPRLPFMARVNFYGGGLGAFEIWIKEGWGRFGWLDVPLPGFVFDLVAAAGAAVAVALVASIRRLRDRSVAGLVAFYLVAGGSLLALLHIVDYRSVLAYDGTLLQGRYILPLCGIIGLAVAAALQRLPRRWRLPLSGAVLGAMALAQLLALGTVAKVYYT